MLPFRGAGERSRQRQMIGRKANGARPAGGNGAPHLNGRRPERVRPANPLRFLPAVQVNVEAAVAALWSNRLRSGLTMLGVIIGVASVIVLIAFGQGAEKEVTS